MMFHIGWMSCQQSVDIYRFNLLSEFPIREKQKLCHDFNPQANLKIKLASTRHSDTALRGIIEKPMGLLLAFPSQYTCSLIKNQAVYTFSTRTERGPTGGVIKG